MQRLYVNIKNVISDVFVMWYVMWIIGTQDLRARFFDVKLDLDIKDKEGK